MHFGKIVFFLSAIALATATSAEAQGKKNPAAAKPTRAECNKKVSAMPGMSAQGRLMRGAGQAIERCMRGEPI